MRVIYAVLFAALATVAVAHEDHDHDNVAAPKAPPKVMSQPAVDKAPAPTSAPADKSSASPSATAAPKTP